jgi:hypothetical protein
MLAWLEGGEGNTYKVAVVVRLAIVVADELHRVALDNVLGERLGKVLCGGPEGGDGLNVLVQAEDEAVLFLVAGHELERVVVDVAEHLDAGLDAPVPLVVEHQGVAEEEARLVAAHVAVADGVAVDDLLLLHFVAHTGGLVLVDPLGEGPVLLGDPAVLCLARDEGGGDALEFVVKVIVIEEDPVVVELAVEAVLDLADRVGNVPDVRIAGKGDKGSVHALARGRSRGQVLVCGCGGRRNRGHSILRCGSGGVDGCFGGRIVLDGAVAGPGRGRGDRRRGADEVEEDEGLLGVSRRGSGGGGGG